MEHLGPLSVKPPPGAPQGRPAGNPQGSPRLMRSWSKGKLNRRSAEFDSDTGSAGERTGGIDQ